MPRNASGVYSLPTGNPVTTGTAISSTVHNATLADLAAEVQDSLSRSGKGGMLSPFLNADGTLSEPGISFTNDSNTGIYRSGSDEVALVAGGHATVTYDENGATAHGTFDVTGAASVAGTLTASGGIALTGRIARTNLPAANLAASALINFSHTGDALEVDVTNSEVSITPDSSLQRAILVMIAPARAIGSQSAFFATGSVNDTVILNLYQKYGAGGAYSQILSSIGYVTAAGGAKCPAMLLPASTFVPLVSGDVYFKLTVQNMAAGTASTLQNFKLIAYEL